MLFDETVKMVIEPENLIPDNLAQEILSLSRNILVVNLRFLEASISQLKLQRSDETGTMAVDGQFLIYNPTHILDIYNQQKENPVRDFLHAIFHCLFHHPFVDVRIDQSCWDLACDIAVENAINDLGLNAAVTSRQARQVETIAKLKKRINLMTAEKLYRFFLDLDYSEEKREVLRRDFSADDHGVWYRLKQQGKDGKEKEKTLGRGNPQDRSGKKKKYLPIESSPVGLKERWKKISERAQVEIGITTRKWGNVKGGLHQNLRMVNRETYDYTAFLKRFSELGEAIQINDDEFDQIYYTYGLSLYKNLPLIEPLEYKEVRRIKEFIIAIDTSGSVQGKIVHAFIQKTFNLLKQKENFFTRINIHIIQCDAAVQEDHKITNIVEVEEYLRSMVLMGVGGTDFRPVFTYVDKLIIQNEFENLKGLIYFTDGCGIFPTQKPDYETAFVFLDDEDGRNPEVPAWAIKLVLNADDLME